MVVLNRDDVIERVESGEEKFQGETFRGKKKGWRGDQTLPGEFGWGRMVI